MKDNINESIFITVKYNRAAMKTTLNNKTA